MSGKLVKWALIFGAVSTGSVVMAATSAGTLTATAAVLGSCTIGSATLAFGVYDPASTVNNDTQTTVSVLCTSGTNYSIYSTTPIASRFMTTGAGTAGMVLAYGVQGSAANRLANIQLPLTHTTGSITGTGTGTPQAVDLFGRVAALQNVVAGAYTNSAATANLTIDY